MMIFFKKGRVLHFYYVKIFLVFFGPAKVKDTFTLGRFGLFIFILGGILCNDGWVFSLHLKFSSWGSPFESLRKSLRWYLFGFNIWLWLVMLGKVKSIAKVCESFTFFGFCEGFNMFFGLGYIHYGCGYAKVLGMLSMLWTWYGYVEYAKVLGMLSTLWTWYGYGFMV